MTRLKKKLWLTFFLQFSTGVSRYKGLLFPKEKKGRQDVSPKFRRLTFLAFNSEIEGRADFCSNIECLVKNTAVSINHYVRMYVSISFLAT